MTERNESGTSEGTMLAAAARGDRKAFENVCIRVLPNLLSFVQSKCRHMRIPRDLSEDFAHDALLKGIDWLGKHRFSTVHNGWLRQVAFRAMQDWRRRENSRRIVAQHNFNDKIILARSLSQYDTVGEVDRVYEALLRLPPQDQQVLRLILMENAKRRDVARRLGIGEWAVYKRYERALAKLRDLLGAKATPRRAGVCSRRK